MEPVMMTRIVDRVPNAVKTLPHRLFRIFRNISNLGLSRLCPVCGKHSRRFLPAGWIRRDEARCMHCGSLERHRLSWLYFVRRTDLFDGRPKRMLHVAPEACMRPALERRLGAGYITADLSSRDVSINLDIASLPYPDGYFDVIYCSHVLEHVEDDRKAMREFLRTLADDGWAILLVPILAEKTFEDPSIVTPEERLKVYLQADHVRIYGRDYVERLRDEGFEVEVTTVADLVSPKERIRFGLGSALSGEIYRCRKPKPAP